jgi:Cu/Ag efflux protein CusF
MNKNTMMIVAVVLVIVGVGGGFFGGMMYQKNQTSPLGGTSRGNYAGRFGQTGQNAGFRPVRGQILNMDSKTITVKLSDGSTKIVVLSGSTVFMKSITAALTDLKTGDTVNVVGSQNADGSVTAQDVQINPPGRPTSTPAQ